MAKPSLVQMITKNDLSSANEAFAAAMQQKVSQRLQVERQSIFTEGTTTSSKEKS